MINKVHCFFEQSGTFKNEFLKLGIQAADYDLKNDFLQTDVQIDLFQEIRNAYYHSSSIFDNIRSDDLIMAFFPCVRFEQQYILSFTCNGFHQCNWSFNDKIESSLRSISEVSDFYALWNMLFSVCYDRKLRLIVENPYSSQHFIIRYWFQKPSLIDYDRRLRGDYYKKPTAYWFLNFSPANNIIFEPLRYNAFDSNIVDLRSEDYKSIANNREVARSLIHKDYANRFIREYIL